MALFSHRKGLKPLRNPLQVDDVDGPLRNLLWSVLHDVYFNYVDEEPQHTIYGVSRRAQRVRSLISAIWCELFKHPSDTHPDWDSAIREIRRHFFAGQWNEVYDLMEFVAKCDDESAIFVTLCNHRLEQENSCYRFVGSEIVPITSPVEIKEVETAAGCGIAAAEKHITTALALLGDRKNPDYRNSVKEAISAVETVCRTFGSGNTLSHALKVLRQKVDIHPAFEKSLAALYAYTSDDDGVRHSLMDRSNLSFSDAKFMVVACSAFANYLIGKAAESGIKPNR